MSVGGKALETGATVAMPDRAGDGRAAPIGALDRSAAAESERIERIELIELARDLAHRELMPAAGAIDAGSQDAIDACWQTICEVGLDRALLAEEHGGAGIAIDDLLRALEELAVGDGGLALSVLLSNAALASLPPARVAQVPQGARWAAVPVGWGADLTLNDRQIEGISLLGLGAHRADGIVFAFPCCTQQPHQRCCSVLYGAKGAEGLVIVHDDHQLGLRGAAAAKIELRGSLSEGDDGAGERSAHIGGGDVAHVCLQSLLRRGAAAIAQGIASRAEQLASEYALARRQGGVPIVQHDAVSDMLGAMVVRRSGCASISRGPSGPDGHRTEAEAAVSAKIAASEAAVETCTDAVQVFGGTGYMRETGVEKLLRDAMTLSLFPEPNWVALDELTRARRETS